MTDTLSLMVAIGAFVAVIVGYEMTHRRWRRGPRRWKGSAARRTIPKPLAVVTGAAGQLEAVMGATFEAKPLMSKGEAAIFYAAEQALTRLGIKGRVMAQVCLGEVLRSRDDAAFRAINSKRVDILVISSNGLPLAAIEYQGEGHYQGTAYVRDAVKKAALQNAGIAYIEATPQHRPEDVERDIARAMEARARRAPAPKVRA